MVGKMKSIMKEIKEINASNGRWVSKDQSKWLVETLERYEKALKEIAESVEDSSCNELALKYEVIAEQALND